jgi:4-hydroxybenzoate polyprenyltransferase
VLLFVPLMLAHLFLDPIAWLRVGLGFVALGVVASAGYIVNDLSDLSADRVHATKRTRPIAKGEISIPSALRIAAALGIFGIAGGFLIDLRFGGLLIAYVTLTLAYSLRLKAIALLDVFVLGMLYTLRIVMGGFLISSKMSPWLLVFSLFFFYSLSTAKRHSEIARAEERGVTCRIHGRGYLVSDGLLILVIGVAASVAAALVLFEWVASDAYPIGHYPSPQWLWATPFLVFLWTTRIWLKSHRGRLDDDAVLFALKDPPSWLLGALLVVCFGLALI